jgi:hypothetical protein
MIVRMSDNSLDLDAIERDLIDLERAMEQLEAGASDAGASTGDLPA